MSDLVLFNKSLKKEDRQKIETDIFNYRSKELFINLSPKDIPPKGHKDREAFLDWEEEKCTVGVTVSGIYIPGTFYWDMNHFAIMKDIRNSRGIIERKALLPDVRDNDWMIHKALYESEKNRSNLVLGTARQVSKSKNIGSVFSRDLMLFDNVELLLMAGAEIYLTPIIQYILVGTENCTDFFRVPRITRDKKAKILSWGFKTKEGEDIIKSKLHIRNAQEGQNTEVSAGLTLNRAAIDEIATFSVKSSYQTVLPALIGPDGIRSSSICAFCVCEGTKVFDKNGKVCNIEDITLDTGIIGYDGQSALQQDVKWLKPTTEKPCIRITTKTNSVLECSEDHPLLVTLKKYNTHRKNKSRRDITFKKAKELSIGDNLLMISKVNIFGEKINTHARLLGLLIGDGTYSRTGNVHIGTPDVEVHDFIENNYSFNQLSKYNFFTQDGLEYKRYAIKGVNKIIKEAGILGQTKLNKRLPANIEEYDKESLCELLGGYFDADGNVNLVKRNSIRIVLTSICFPLLEQVKFQLLKLGIRSSILKEYRATISLGSEDHIYRLYIQDYDSVLEFQKNISFLIKEKQSRLNKVLGLKVKSMRSEKKCHFIKGNKGKYFEGMEDMEGLKVEVIKKIEYLGMKKVINLTTTPTHTYITNGFISANTGGNVDRSKDAEEIFLNPKANGFNGFEEEGKSVGKFIGGWYRQDLKVYRKFGEWLGISDPNSELNLITARITDVEKADKVLDEEMSAASKSVDPTALTKFKMYNPRKISDMFLSPDKNPFPTQALERHREYLKDNYNGKPVDLYRDVETGKINWRASSKLPVFQYPVRDQNMDLNAPIVIYEFPKYTEHYALHVAGFDPVNGLNSTAESDSLASIYVMRRNHTDLKDPYRNCIVASYTARPNSFRKDFLKNVEMLQEFYNMQILHEDSGNGITLYFDTIQKSNILMDTFSLQKSMNVNSNSNSSKGLKANAPNNSVREEVVLAYLEEELEDGNLGLVRIPDPMLVEELLAYDGMGKGTKNTDRVDAFSYALLQCTSLEKYNKTRPFITHTEIEKRAPQKMLMDAFGRVIGTNRKGNVFRF